MFNTNKYVAGMLATFGLLSVLKIDIVSCVSLDIDTSAANIIFITLDDVGFNDIGGFGAEWNTPHFDNFLKESISMSHHYSGYTDSASRSQIMTGLYSWHTGYGKQGSKFSTNTIGGLPLGSGTMSEYLKEFGNYDTFYIGGWGLGHTIKEHTPTYRGFDYFYGTYSIDTNVLTKGQSISKSKTDPSLIINDDNKYFDFWENEKSISKSEALLSDSNTQYTDKLIQILNSNLRNESPFFTFLSYQGVTQYRNSSFKFADSIESQCLKYVKKTDENRLYMCNYMLSLDIHFGKIITHLKNTNLWQNTLIVVTSDNGGSLSYGSCNYPLRGGKYSFYDGNMRSLALIGGGVASPVVSASSASSGLELDGLMSNVDWLPTILSFANIVPNDWTKVENLDGYNLYNYILQNKNEENSASASSVATRDHILLDLEMFGTEVYAMEKSSHKRQWAWTEAAVNNHKAVSLTLTGLAMVFYDENGQLFKYFVTNKNDEVTNDDISLDYNWCYQDNYGNTEFTSFNTGKLRPFSGLFDLTNDISEQTNLLQSISSDDFTTLKEIIQEKADYYIDSDYSELSKYTYDSFNCFYKSYNILTYPQRFNGKWTQSFDDSNTYFEFLRSECGFSEEHPILQLHTSAWSDNGLAIEDNSEMTSTLNSRVPDKTTLTIDNGQKSTKLFKGSNVVTKAGILAAAKKSLHKKVMKDKENVYASCAGLKDGMYHIQIDFDSSKPILTAQCSNGYMLIDYSSENNWKEYFSSWIQFHWQVASPFKSDYADFTKWFLPDSEKGTYDYILSYDCDACDETSLLQTEGTSTTYWQSTVPNFCGSADKGVNAADEMWDYQCRNAVFSSGYGGAELIDIWHMTDENGIDRDLLLTQLSTTDSHLGICSSLKKAANYDNFKTQSECAEGQKGEMPVLGLEGKFCICAKKSQEETTSKKLLNSKMRAQMQHYRGLKLESQAQEDDDASTDADSNVHYLYQSDFNSGTYRIRESGTYVIMEDITFDYNAPDYTNDPDYSANSFDSETGDMHWYPKQTQKDDYPGAYAWRDEYHLGFFAGITIEVDDVTLDLNGNTMAMDERYFFQQPFWSHIQFGSSNFIPGKGPSPLGANPQFVSNVNVKNGILGLTSHHCMHGTSPKHSEMTNIVIEDIVCKDFTTHGIQLNGFNGLTINNVEVGPTNAKHLLTSDYSNMRTLLPRFKYFADLYSDTTYKFGGKPSREYMKENNIDVSQVSLNNEDEYTLSDLLDMAIEQMDMAFDYVMKRKTEQELYDEYGDEWLQAKRVFVFDQQSGIPYGGSMYGVYLNYPGTGITGFYTNNEVSKNVNIDGLYIHDLTHGTVETVCLTDHSKSIFGVAVSASKLLGDTNFNDWANIRDLQSSGEMYYYGTIVYDLFLAFYDIVSQDDNNVDALNMGVFEDETLEWAKTGDYQSSQKWSLTCGNDPMFHAVKGLYGLRISGIEGARVNNLKIENMKEISNIGTDACGSFVVFSQQQPYMYGYSGNNVHSVSVLHSDVLFNNVEIFNIESTTGNSTAVSIYPRSNVQWEGENNKISNIIAGSQYQNEDYEFDELLEHFGGSQYPNPMPRACAVLKDNFDTVEAWVTMGSMSEYDSTKFDIECISGYLDCSENEVSLASESDWTVFGTYIGESKDSCLYEVDIDDSSVLTTAKIAYLLNPHNYSLFAIITVASMILISCFVCYYNQSVISKLQAQLQGYSKI